ncbi:antirestriction protein ArdA [Nocardioides sp. MAHUQ-72]|uniref:antirestriction protein ArdA n=1 Tax=unclassified Nocardioides TaxID=2615069 RepID=UPI00361E8DE3
MIHTTTTAEPAVWIGCLECYNSGRLVGDWRPALEAGDITPDTIHGRDVAPGTHEELWVMDHEGLPIKGECSPTFAQRAAECLEEVDEWLRSAFLAWWASGDFVAAGDDLPCPSDFFDRYAGEWGSFSEYAEDLFTDCGYADEIPDHLAAYFDMDAWVRDLRFDYSTEPAPNGGVYVFRSL